jgi:hypothetical protein
MAVQKPRGMVVSLNQTLDETNNLHSLCKKIVRFTRWQHHWPTAGDLYRKYNKGTDRYTLGALKHYMQLGCERGWLERLPSSAVRFTPAYYRDTNTTVLQPELSSSAGARSKQKTHLAKVWQAARKLKKAGLWPEQDEYDKYRDRDNPDDGNNGPADSDEDGRGDWRSSPFRRGHE